MPLWLWMGRDLQLFVAVRRADTIHVLDKRQWKMSDKRTLMNVLETLREVMDWGWECYRPWLLGILGQEGVPLPGEDEEPI